MHCSVLSGGPLANQPVLKGDPPKRTELKRNENEIAKIKEVGLFFCAGRCKQEMLHLQTGAILSDAAIELRYLGTTANFLLSLLGFYILLSLRHRACPSTFDESLMFSGNPTTAKSLKVSIKIGIMRIITYPISELQHRECIIIIKILAVMHGHATITSLICQSHLQFLV